MIAVVMMGIATIMAAFFLLEVKRAERDVILEVVLARSWSCRFARQTLEEQRETFLRENEKHHTVSAKKAAKKMGEWEKQILLLREKEKAYSAGERFLLCDLIPLLGYGFLAGKRYENGLLRKIAGNCEKSGYVELERGRKTEERMNSVLYAAFLLASMIACLYMGVMFGLFMGVVAIAMGKEGAGVVLPVAAAFGGLALIGYLPCDGIQVRATKRREEIDRELPDAVSKLALLTAAGMSIVRAVEETAASGSTLIYQELRIVVQEINKAATVQEAFVRLQNRCSNKYLDKLVTIVTKSYVSGNTNLADDLKNINDECWLDRKHNTRRMSEKIQNRLFVPTMLMFVGILVVIIVPAMSGFNL